MALKQAVMSILMGMLIGAVLVIGITTSSCKYEEVC